MTTLSVSFPDIPFKASATTAAEAAATYYSEFNLVRGPRYLHYKSATADTSCYFQYNLGSTYATKGGVVNHVILAGHMFEQTLSQVLYEDSANGSDWTARLTDDAPVFYGPDSRDYVGTLTATNAAQYHKVTLTFARAEYKRFSKLYLGRSWTPAVSPAGYSIERIPGVNSSIISSSGAVRMCRAEPTKYRIQVRWDLLTSAEIAAFQSNIARYAELSNFFLYTTTQHDILDNQRILHCSLVRSDINRSGGVSNKWALNTTWQELAG